MKMRNVVFAAVAAVAAGTTAKAEVSARVWMLDHSDPNSDELSELRTENPDAYALVKALLTKRSLGLLDPKHPTASFSKPAPEEEGSHPVGAAVYAKFATTDKERQALAGAEPAYDTSSVEDEVVTPAPSGSHDWLSWSEVSGSLRNLFNASLTHVKSIDRLIVLNNKSRSSRCKEDKRSCDFHFVL